LTVIYILECNLRAEWGKLCPTPIGKSPPNYNKQNWFLGGCGHNNGEKFAAGRLVDQSLNFSNALGVKVKHWLNVTYYL